MTPFDIVYRWPNKRGGSSISNADCDFLRDLCLKYVPTKILELGTGSGKSTWAMALSSQCEIHTIDRDDWYSHVYTNDSIHRYNMESSKWFDSHTIANFDFVFIDALIPYQDYGSLLKRLANKCSIVLHDYKNTDAPEKGNENVKSILMHLLSGDNTYNYEYNLTNGGECCAHIRLER